jgi:hypothetical protein
MHMTPDELLAEAGRMALELRLKDRALAIYEAELARLRARVAELEQPAGEPDPLCPGP